MKTRILCLEGEWDKEHQDVTVEPLLRLLQSLDAWNNKKRRSLSVEHHLCQSANRLKFKLQNIDQRNFPSDSAFNCLYLAFHGNKCGLYADNEPITFAEIANCVGSKAKDKIVFFSSCGERGIEKELTEFKEKSQALLVVGYDTEVDWFAASLFEIWFFNKLLDRTRKIDGHFTRSLQSDTQQKIFKALKIIAL